MARSSALLIRIGFSVIGVIPINSLNVPPFFGIGNCSYEVFANDNGDKVTDDSNAKRVKMLDLKMHFIGFY